MATIADFMDPRFHYFRLGLSNDTGLSGPVFLHLDQYNYEGIFIG